MLDMLWTLLNCILAVLHCVFEVAVIVYIVNFFKSKK